MNTTKLIPPRLSTSPYFATPTISNGCFGCERRDLDRVADVVALLVGRPDVDDDLVVGRAASGPRRG